MDEAAAQRHQDELADANRNHQYIVNGLELLRVGDAAQVAHLRLEVEEAACFQSILTAHITTVKMQVKHCQLLHAHTATRGAMWTLQTAHEGLRIELLATATALTDPTVQLDTCREELEAKTAEAAKEQAVHAATKASPQRHQDDVSNKTRTLSDANPNHQHTTRQGWLLVLITPIVLVLLFVFFIYENHAITKTSLADTAAQLDTCRDKLKAKTETAFLATLRSAQDKEKILMYEVFVFLDGKGLNALTIARARDICIMRMEVEKNMTADGLIYIGLRMYENETITINDITYNKKRLHLKALELDPRLAKSHSILGTITYNMH